jgi:hypothetical protein
MKEKELRGADVCVAKYRRPCGDAGAAALEKSGTGLSCGGFKNSFSRVQWRWGDVGPFPHGTQARELELMVEYGMKPVAALQADLLNGAKLLGWGGQIGELRAGYFADVIAVPGNPLEDISVTTKVSFVMKGGVVYKQ